MNSAVSRVAVVVATLGRPEVVTATVSHLLKTQVLKPAAVIVSCVSKEDAGDVGSFEGVTVVVGKPGSSAQRNAAFAHLPSDIDIVVFFDDDFVADPYWLSCASRAFGEESDLFGFTGHVIADGIKGPGYSFDEAVRIVENAATKVTWSRIEPYSPYGCNMAFRLSAVGPLRFDERLVLYGWLEDLDFGSALTKERGKLVKFSSARGVHMGSKKGRVKGDRLGYSQVVNPAYLFEKGTMTIREAILQITRNIASNVAYSFRPEPFIDRRGRLRGNMRGLFDLSRGLAEPERAGLVVNSR